MILFEARNMNYVCFDCQSIWDRVVDDDAACCHCGSPVCGPLATREISKAVLDGYNEEKARQIKRQQTLLAKKRGRRGAMKTG